MRTSAARRAPCRVRPRFVVRSVAAAALLRKVMAGLGLVGGLAPSRCGVPEASLSPSRAVEGSSPPKARSGPPLRRQSSRPWAALLLACLALGGCAAAPRYEEWRRPGAGAAQFEGDLRDCRIWSGLGTLGADQPGGGRREGDGLAACLRAKGWSDWKADEGARLRDGILEGPGLRLRLPRGCSPAPGDPVAGRFSLRGEAGEAVEIAFEKRHEADAWADRLGLADGPPPPPLVPPLALYDRGTLLLAGKPAGWTSFFMRAPGGGGWIGGVVVAVDLAPGSRLVFSAAEPLPPAEAPPAPGLRLTPGQGDALERRALGWLDLLARSITK